jgi:hypothetical protein
VSFSPFPLQFEPGIQRDNTLLSTNGYTDGLWCRFQYGKPRKIGGYAVTTPYLTAISRALLSQTQSGFSYIHSGFASGIESVQIAANGTASAPANRTPGGAFTPNPNNVWQLDTYYDINSGQQQLLAFVVPALSDIAYGATTGQLYYGPIYATTALTQDTDGSIATDATGGVCVLPPYTFLYGSNGLVQWSLPAQPLVFTDNGSNQAGAARVTGQKIVRMLPIRGGTGFTPAALLWSIDSVILMYFIGGPQNFAFDTLSSDSTILSHNAIIESDQKFYWVGVDRFLIYDGSVHELPNTRNLNYFFDNLNRPYAQKVFALKNSRYGEIWFCAPLFGATEPNVAVIYNYRENTWYDTFLPNTGRSFGIQNDIAGGTFMSGIQLFGGSTYRLWQHEVAVDEVDVSNTNAVPSYFTTPLLSAESFQMPQDKNIHIDMIIPDMVQTGAMTLTANARGNARASFTPVTSATFQPPPAVGNDQQVPVHASARQITLTMTSNVRGGTYQCGKHVAYIEPDQGRRTQ